MSASPTDTASAEIKIRAEVDQLDVDICRFIVDRTVHEGADVFTSKEEAKNHKLAANLFVIPGISRVELNDNLIAVTKAGHDDWRQVGKRIGGAIRLFLNPPPAIPDGEMLPPEVLRERIQRVLDEQINPGVASHGGYVELLDITDNNVFLRMGGGCQGCGAADVTLKMGVEKLLREEVPQIQNVFDSTDHAAGNNPYYAPSK
jgi:NFU1 iron-sulfur cluster scaffold homolog, mitochondrial